jgi:signal transduction histidine kinase
VLALTGKQLEQSGIQLRYNASNQLLPIIAVGDQIKQVFLNLILNAIEAMPDGGMLTIDTQQQTSTLSITLADTGIGIPPDIMPHLFEPFFSTKHTGSGLGLAVSHEIITNHGGTLTAVNPTTHTVTNPGAAFLITLPSISPNEG